MEIKYRISQTWQIALLLGLILGSIMTIRTVQAQSEQGEIFFPILANNSSLSSTPTPNVPPNLVLAKQPSMHPEGIEWDEANGRFLVGSLTQGTVFAVADDGTVTPFATSDNLSMGSVGIHIDKATNRLLVTHSNPTALASEEVVGVAQLGIYDLTTGEELHFVDLTELGAPGGRFFANDVTSDADGNAYVTNSLSTAIYKVDSDGNGEVFVNNLGANGIDYHADGYLLAAATQNPGLVKIPLDDPTALAPVTLSEPASMDGIILDANGGLVAVAKTQFGADGSFEDEVLTFKSDDNWATADVVARGVAIPESAPTTVALRDGRAYVVHAHFAELGAGTPVPEFEIKWVEMMAEVMPPNLVLAKQPSMHPEGIEWDEGNGRFLVGSLTQGTVFAVADGGTVTPFATSDNLSMGSVGIHIDKATNRLLVTHSNPTALASEEVVGVAQLGIYDLTSGEELHFVDLTELGAPGGRFFANDVTSDADGNAYVTNSLSTAIYKVDSDGNGEVFVNNLGANGIDYHADGYLLAAATQNPGLVKIPLDDPTALAPVTLSEPASMDGIILDANGGLVAVAKTQFGADGSFEDEVLTFKSDDDWATADVVARGVAIPESSPTTVALRDGRAYVVHAHFAELGAGTLVPEFEIKWVEMMAETVPYLAIE